MLTKDTVRPSELPPQGSGPGLRICLSLINIHIDLTFPPTMEPWLLQTSTRWAGDDFLNTNWSIYQVGFCSLGTYTKHGLDSR
jgi:hypothetical protein